MNECLTKFENKELEAMRSNEGEVGMALTLYSREKGQLLSQSQTDYVACVLFRERQKMFYPNPP